MYIVHHRGLQFHCMLAHLMIIKFCTCTIAIKQHVDVVMSTLLQPDMKQGLNKAFKTDRWQYDNKK